MPEQDKAVSTAPTGIARAVLDGVRVAGSGSGRGKPGRGRGPGLAETAAKTVMAGAVEARGGGSNGLALIQQTAADLVRGAGDVDANVADTAKGAVAGAIDAGQETGIDKSRAAEAAAMGAIEGAGEVGGTAVEHVKQVVTGAVDTVTPLDHGAFARGRRTP